jgi:ribosomal protein S20
MSKFEQHLKNILSNNNHITGNNSQKSTVKTASTEVSKDITVESIRKIATILRNTNAEPSYEDLAKFVDRIV